MDELISVIVPIYNVGKYLKKCVDSILNQTYPNIEVILIDDGSSDEGSKICDNYAEKNGKVKVIHKKNGGITSARKAGVLEATGEYIGFVDGDDWIEPKMYEILYSHLVMNDVDIVLSGMYRDNDKEIYTKWSAAKIPAGIYDNISIMCNFFAYGINNVSGSLNNKLFRKRIIEDNLLKISDSIKGADDDLICTFSSIKNSKRIEIIDDAFYHGYDRSNSATRSRIDNYYEQVDLVRKYLYMYIDENDSLLKRQIDEYLANKVVEGLKHISEEMVIPRYYWKDECYKKIVLYGAGVVGQSYYKQISASNMHEIVRWVDKNNYDNELIYSVENLKTLEFDKIIIAVLDKTVAENIRNELLDLGIEENKIEWKRPLSIIEFYNSKINR